MNLFRLIGDLSHLSAILLLLWKVWKTRSVAGISGKSQILFALVFVTRYLDLVTSFVSLYNTFMKVIFITATVATCYMILMKFKATYDANHDSFRVEFLVVPVAGLSVLVNHDLSVMEDHGVWVFLDMQELITPWEFITNCMSARGKFFTSGKRLLEVLWTFSIYLESVAILPQLFLISKTGEAESITSHYLFALGSYRALYVLNWIYRYYFEGFFDIIVVVAGCVQTVLYCDFFYLYVTKVLKGKNFKLPA